jgi:lysophospholipase L1-like esterase
MRLDDLRRPAVKRVAAYGGGSLGAGAVGIATLAGVLLGETKIARRRIPKAETDPPVSHDTLWTAAGVSPHRPPIRLAMIGDSTAAGYGVETEAETPAAQLARRISRAARRPVHVTNVAVVGAESKDLQEQLDRLDPHRWPELAVLMVGANDVTERYQPAEPAKFLADAVRRLVDGGAEVVVGTCPDLGTIRPLPQPLRWYARRLSRRLAKAQTVAVVEAGGRTVSLGDLLGPIFWTNHDELFAFDRFHPSAAGYAEAVDAILPSCLDALGLRTRVRSASPFTTRRMKPVEKAAAQAAARPGAEVAPAEPRMPWHRGVQARLRRRRPGRTVQTEVAAATVVPQP